MSTLEAAFSAAVATSKTLAERPDNQTLLRIYALYKQATEGDVNGARPGGFDFKAIAKYDAWQELKGKSKETAMTEYVALVDRLSTQYS